MLRRMFTSLTYLDTIRLRLRGRQALNIAERRQQLSLNGHRSRRIPV